MVDTIDILGVKISKINREIALKTVISWVLQKRKKPYFIVTPNPEMLVLAQYDKQFGDILNSADLAIADGVGLAWASKILAKTSPFPSPGRRGDSRGEVISKRVSGTDFMLELCKESAQKGFTIGLLGAASGVAQKTATVLKEKYPGIKIKFAVSEISQLSSFTCHPELVSGSISIDSRLRGNDKEGKRKAARNDKFEVDLLFVAYGAPKQEKWIFNQVSGVRFQVSDQEVQSKLKLLKPKTSNLKAKVYMGVGGAFDFISGKVKRAPKMMQNLGLEWFWRLVQEPKRLRRIFTATIVFPLLVLKNALTSKTK